MSGEEAERGEGVSGEAASLGASGADCGKPWLVTWGEVGVGPPSKRAGSQRETAPSPAGATSPQSLRVRGLGVRAWRAARRPQRWEGSRARLGSDDLQGHVVGGGRGGLFILGMLGFPPMTAVPGSPKRNPFWKSQSSARQRPSGQASLWAALVFLSFPQSRPLVPGQGLGVGGWRRPLCWGCSTRGVSSPPAL